MDGQKLAELKLFVSTLKANPALLHAPALEFFRDYLLSLGATIPAKEAPKKETPPPKAEEPAHAHAQGDDGHAHAQGGHGHSHGGQACHGHGAPAPASDDEGRPLRWRLAFFFFC